MDKLTFQRVLRRIFLVPLGCALILALTLIYELQFLVNRQAWVEHSDQVINIAQHLYRLRIDQETGLRAYALTRDEQFLQPFHDGRAAAASLEVQLQELIADNPAQQERNAKAVQAFERWSTFASECMALAKLGQDAAEARLQLRGKELMDQYRTARGEFISAEEQLRDQRLAASRRTLRYMNFSIVALSALLGGGLALLGRKQLVSVSRAYNAALDTAQANADEAQAQREWLHTTLKSIGDAVIATDRAGNIVFMNGVAENLTGWSSTEATGKPLPEVFRIVNERTRKTVENPVDKVCRLNQVVGLANHTVLISRNGQEFAIDDSGAPICDAEGRLAGVVLVFRDVTQQRRMEQALQSNERLAVAGRLSASIAHEIHNPLDTVGNLLFLLQQETQTQTHLQQLIGIAQKEVVRVTQISKNMLNLHRESSTASPVLLPEVLDEVVGLIEETTSKGKAHIHVEHGFHAMIQGFPAEMRQVFTNIIKNAVEAAPAGGGIKIFSVAARESGRDGVLVHIADNGTGIAPDMQPKLFTPFVTTKPGRGNGLGLWISRCIVEKHGGSITISSSTDPKNQGTTVSIFLPLDGACGVTMEEQSDPLGRGAA